MFKHGPKLLTLRWLVLAGCLVVFAGCGASEDASAPNGSPSTTQNLQASVPAPPSGLSATAGNAQASLAWSASSGAASYNVKRSITIGGTYTQLAVATSPSYTDSTVSNGTTYYYVVTAANSAGESANSATVSVTPDPTITTPPVPMGLTATAGNAQVSLTWSASSGATSYHVKRATTSGGPYTQVAAPTSTVYNDTSLTNGTTYYYVVSALDAAGESVNSAQASAVPVSPGITIPPVPTGLVTTAGNTQVSLTWSASNGATSYHVKSATTSGGPYSQVGVPTAAAYTNSSLINGTTYYYVVSALNSAGESADSAEASAVPTAGSGGAGTWTNVTPSSIDLVDNLSCGNYGTKSVQGDSSHPADAYTLFFCQGIWKSSDYGMTWTGPINTGSNGALLTDCAGVITVVPTSLTTAPTLYASCIRGTGIGFWKSVNGGVDWTQEIVTQAPSGTGQQFYAPVVDPYDSQHLLMVGHAVDLLIESTNGGVTWSAVNTDPGMAMNGGTGGIQFINTGSPTTTRTTWLWLAAQAGGVIGTWRTANEGANWTKVDNNEHVNGETQIYQPDTSGEIFMAGLYSALGDGVLMSTNFGQTWVHEGVNQPESIVFGTPKGLYAMYGWGPGAGQVVDPLLETGAPSGIGPWTSPGTPAAMSQGPAQSVVLNDGSNNIILLANYNAGLWRYTEP